MAAAAGLGENAGLLHFAIKLFECSLKGAVGIHNNLAHGLPARSAGILVAVAAWLIAILAVDRAIFARLEGHAGLFSAAGADSSVHLAGFAITEATAASAIATGAATLEAAGLFTSSAALRATAGCIGQSAARVKFLLTSSKGKFLVAVATIQDLVGH